jgi:hypothetical protein
VSEKSLKIGMKIRITNFDSKYTGRMLRNFGDNAKVADITPTRCRLIHVDDHKDFTIWSYWLKLSEFKYELLGNSDELEE